MNPRYRSYHIFVAISAVTIVASIDFFRPYGLQLSDFYIAAALYVAWFVPGRAVWYFAAGIIGVALIVAQFNGHEDGSRIDGIIIGLSFTYIIWNRQRYGRILNSSNLAMSGQIHEQISALQQLNTDLNRQIEERLQVESSLRDSEARYRNLIELSPEAIVVTQDGHLVFANEAAVRLIRANSADDLLGHELIEVIDPAQHEIHIERQRTLLASGKPLPPQEYRARRLDGSWVDVEVLAGMCRFQNAPAIQVVVRDLTDSKRLATDVRKLNDFREKVIATAAEGICVCSPGSEFPYIRFSIWNDRMTEITGYTIEEINQVGLFGVIHPGDDGRDGARKLANHIWRCTDFIAKEQSFVRKDGTPRTVTVSISQIALEEGQVAAIALLHDITDRTLTEENLRASEGRFRGLIEAIPDLIFRVDPSGTITYAKSEPADDLLLPAQTLVGKRYHDYMPRSVADRFDAAISAAVKTSCIQTFGYELNLPDGRHQHFEARIVGFPDGSSVLIARNDTERRHALESLRESDLRFRQLAENIREVFWIVSPDGSRIDYISPAYEHIVGRSCASVYAEPTSWLDVVHPDEKKSVAEQFFREARQGYDREYRILRPDGEVRWVRDRTFPVRNECGEVERIVGLGEDITERKRAEDQLATGHERTKVLAQLTKELNDCTTPRAASLLILETARQLIDWECSWIQLWNEQLQAFEGLVEFDLFDDDCREVPQDPNERRSVSPIMRRVMQEGPQLVLRTSETDQTEGFRFVGNQRRSLSMMYVPIRHGEKLVGVLSIQSYQKRAYDQTALELLQLLASHCAGALARIQTAEALQEGERRYRRLLEDLPVGVFVHDGEQFHYVNPRALQILGVADTNELSHRSPIEWVAPEFRNSILQRVEAVLNSDEPPPPTESALLRQDEKRVEVEMHSRRTEFGGRNCSQVLVQDITQRKRAEAELRENRDRLSLVLQAAKVGPWEREVRTGKVTISSEWKHMLGYEDHEIESQSDEWESRIHPDDLPQVLHALREFMAGRQPEFTIEHRIRHRNGSWIWRSPRALLLRDENGEPIRILGCAVDITTRKRAELLLRGQKLVLELAAVGAPLEDSLNELAKALEEHSPGMLCSILVIDRDGTHLRLAAGPSLPPEYKVASDKIPIGPASGSCGSATFHRKPVYVEDIAEDSRWLDFRAAALSAGLRSCWSTPIFDEQSNVLGTFAIYYRKPTLPTSEDQEVIDMATQLAAVVISRHRMIATLQESESRLRTLLENLEHVAVQAYELDGTITFWNRASERLYGYSADAALGRNMVDLLHAESTREGERQLMDEIVRTGVVPQTEEVPVVSRNGQHLWVYANRVLHPRPGKPPEFFCFDVDITARKLAEEELATRQVELLHAARLSTMGQMVATLSHEVAQPLTAIGNFAAASAQILSADSPPPTEKLNEYVHAIVKQNERCSAILDRLRNFSRRTTMRKSLHALASILPEAAELVTSDLRRDGIEICFDYGEDLPLVLVDKIQIQQVLVNLLTNARDAVHDQPIERRQIIVRMQAEDRNAVIEIEDQGKGLAAELTERIFEPFFSTKDTGMGIGLSVSRRIIREHGGDIVALANEYGGATFRVRLPIHHAAPSEPATAD